MEYKFLRENVSMSLNVVMEKYLNPTKISWSEKGPPALGLLSLFSFKQVCQMVVNGGNHPLA